MSDTNYTLIKGYKYRIYPNKEQQEYLSKVFGCCRFIYNKQLDNLKNNYHLFKQGKTIVKPKVDAFSLISDLPVWKNNQDTIWLSEVPAQTLQQVMRHLASSYSNFFKTKKGFPKFKSKFNKQSATFTNQISYVDSNKLYLAKCKIPFKMVIDRPLPNKPISCNVSKNPSGEYYVSFQCQYTPMKTAGAGIIGIDLGIKTLATISDKEDIANPKYYIKSQKRLCRQQRKLSRKKKGSNNRNKQRIKVAKIHQKVSNQRNDYLHKLSTKLVNENQVIVIEDLNVSGMIKNPKLAKHIADAGMGMLGQFLKYKVMQSQWCRLLIADRFYPSTQLCNCCGQKPTQKIKLGVQKWTCEYCSTTHGRDDNASINLSHLATKNMDLWINNPGKIILCKPYEYLVG